MFEWVQGTGMDTSDIQVEVAAVDDLARGELGLIAKAPLVPGDILAWAPTSLLLSKDKALDIWGAVVGDISERMALALLLIHERYVKAESSSWYTYMRSLPRFNGDVSGPSFLWEDEEQEKLQGSDCYGASVGMFNTIVDEFEQLNTTVFASHRESFPADVFTFDRLAWACAIIASRAYGDDAEGTSLSIAPLVDFLNHKAGSLQLTRFGNGIVAYAHKHYDAGEQVWVSYGGKSNAEILSQYGFVDVDNAQEAVYLRIGEHLLVEEPFAEKKLELIGELLGDGRDPSSSIYKLTQRPRDWQATLLPTLRILSLSTEDKLPASATDLVPQQDARLEGAAFARLQDAISRRAAEYPASLKEDRETLAGGGISERHALALELRISEQELLELTGDYAGQQLALAEAKHASKL